MSHNDIIFNNCIFREGKVSSGYRIGNKAYLFFFFPPQNISIKLYILQIIGNTKPEFILSTCIIAAHTKLQRIWPWLGQ